MKSVVSYLCSDGEVHVFDTAQRRIPLCAAEVMVIGRAESAERAMACEECCVAVLDAVEESGRR